MALNNISELSTTAASNTDFAGTSILGTGLVSTADDSFRNLASFEAKWWNDIGAVNTVAGTGDAVTVTTLTLYTAHKTGMMFRFVAGAANTGPATLNLDSIGAKAIRKISGGTDVALAAGDIAAGETYTVIYRASANSAAGAWVIVGAAAVAAATTSAFGTVKLATSGQVLAPPVGSTLVPTIPDLYFPTGHLWGLTLSNNAGTPASKIDVAVGSCRDSTDAANFVLTGALTAKDLASAWAVGSSAGLLDTGSIANTTYHIWLIKRPDTGVVDVLASTSASAPTMPTNYTLKRRIGSIVRVGGSIKAFVQVGDEFLWTLSANDLASSTLGTTATSFPLTVPLGIKVIALFNAFTFKTSTAVNVLLYSPDQTDETAAFTSGRQNVGAALSSSSSAGSGQYRIRTDTSGNIKGVSDTAATNLYIGTVGYYDTRGRI